MHKIASVILSLMLAGCVQTAEITTPFHEPDYAYALQPGTAEVSGQAFLRRNDGVVVYGAGGIVLLIPSTPYTREISSRGTAAPVSFTNFDERLAKYVKRAQADGEGRFKFSGVPDGEYIASASVTWMAGRYRQGGEINKTIVIEDGKSVDVILTR
ncbi:MAG: hypothetical protein ABJG86_09895 [Nitratireductor sp.]|uniref:hypothetical protein n=1 Tax=Alphaproteobacteria TaxID=28211 RepID=UPI00327E9F82